MKVTSDIEKITSILEQFGFENITSRSSKCDFFVIGFLNNVNLCVSYIANQNVYDFDVHPNPDLPFDTSNILPVNAFSIGSYSMIYQIISKTKSINIKLDNFILVKEKYREVIDIRNQDIRC